MAILLNGPAPASAQEIRFPERWNAKPAARILQTDTVTIRVLGDLMMHSDQIRCAERPDGKYDFSSYFTHIKKYLEGSDLNVGNMEFTLGGAPYTGYPAFSSPDEYAYEIAESGFNIFLAANNHICDTYGPGMKRTLEIYRKMKETHGIHFTGIAGNAEEKTQTTPLIVEVRGIRIGIINATYGTNLSGGSAWPATNYLNDRKTLQAALKKAEESADITIAFIHWGEEYILKHNSSQEKTAGWLAENGADIIIGGHPHVAQDAGTIKVETEEGAREVPVAYSLGNAISNMSAANTQIGLMATIRLVRKLNGRIECLPLKFTYLWSSRPGGYGRSYTILPVEEQLENSEAWHGKWEHEKMTDTYNRVRKATGIKE